MLNDHYHNYQGAYVETSHQYFDLDCTEMIHQYFQFLKSQKYGVTEHSLMGLRGGLSGILGSAKGTEIGIDSILLLAPCVSPFFGEFKTDQIFEHIKALKKSCSRVSR